MCVARQSFSGHCRTAPSSRSRTHDGDGGGAQWHTQDRIERQVQKAHAPAYVNMMVSETRVAVRVQRRCVRMEVQRRDELGRWMG